MQIEPGIEGLFIEVIDAAGKPFGDVAVPHMFAHNAGIFALSQRIVVAVT